MERKSETKGRETEEMIAQNAQALSPTTSAYDHIGCIAGE
jgi:hypothetical protein